MREIKFRAWNSESEIMIYSDKPEGDYWWELQPKVQIGCIVGVSEGNTFEPPEPIVEYITEIMQFTGLLDKNGKEIYEGDIVRCINNHTGVIEWEKHDACFNVSDYYQSSNDYPTMAFMEGQPFEVIGNIYDNPDLC